jgi:hypothetical protein
MVLKSQIATSYATMIALDFESYRRGGSTVRTSRKALFRGIGLMVLAGGLFAAWWWYHDFFPKPPNHVGVIEHVSNSERGYHLTVREGPIESWITAATNDEQRWSARASGTITIHVTSSTKILRNSASGPHFGQSVRVWTDGMVLISFPGQAYATKIEYGPVP